MPKPNPKKAEEQSKGSNTGIEFKQYPILSRLIKDKRAVASIHDLQELNIPSKLSLIEELSNFIIQSPEEHV